MSDRTVDRRPPPAPPLRLVVAGVSQRSATLSGASTVPHVSTDPPTPVLQMRLVGEAEDYEEAVRFYRQIT